MSSFQQYLLGMFLVIVGVNVVGSGIIHYLTWQKLSNLETQTAQLTEQAAAAIQVLPTPVATPAASGMKASTTTSSALLRDTTKVDQTAFDFIVESLQGKLSSVEARLLAVEKKQAAAATPANSTQAVTQTIVKTSTQLKEQTVFMGSGSSTNTEWTDVPSASIELNSANYTNVERVIFEATLSIVGGEARARLKNKTTGGIIYPSEVKHNSSTATTVLSGSFALAAGSNEYVVQLRSSSNEAAVLDGARLRLFYR